MDHSLRYNTTLEVYEVVGKWKLFGIIPLKDVVYSSWKLSDVEKMIEQLRKAEGEL